MAIVMPSVTDDNGSGTTGTILDLATWTALGTAIDTVLLPVVQTVALTGAQDVTLTPGCTELRCTNATLLTINKLVGGVAGQRIAIVAAGAGQVDLPHFVAAANQFLNASGLTASLGPGVTPQFVNGNALVEFDAAISLWRVIYHEQGAWIAYTPTWGNTGTANTLGNGSLTGAYRISGRTLQFRETLTWGSTTAAGSGAWTFTFPVTVGAGAAASAIPVIILDATVGNQVAVGKYFTATTWVPYSVAAPGGVTATTPMTWTVSDALSATGTVEL